MAEDWLPHEPIAAPPRKGSAPRTFFIWAVLIVMFVAIYQVFSTPDAPIGRHATGTHAVAPIVNGYSGWWIVLAAVCGLALPIALLIWQFRGSAAYNAQQRAALEANAEGNYARGAALFREMLPRNRGRLSYWAFTAYSLGHSLTRAGDSAAAIGALLGVERSPVTGVRGLGKLVAIELARAFAIGGDVDKAEKWLAAARTRPGELKGDAQVEAVHGLILCRQGRFDDALAHYEQVSGRLESQLTVKEMCEPWLLRAFAMASTSTPRDSGASDAWLRIVRTAPGEVAWLTARWPELATFAATHGLAFSGPGSGAANTLTA